MKPFKIIPLFFCILLVAAGCASLPTDQPQISTPVVKPALNQGETLSFDDDLDSESLLLALERSLLYYSGPGRHRSYPLAGRVLTATQIIETLTTFRNILQSSASNEEKKKRIAEEFLAIPAAEENSDVLFTGYYEPLLEGSLTRTDVYQYPLYKPPPDIVTKKISANEIQTGRMVNNQFVPYYTRWEIDMDQTLQGKNLELLWVSDPVELHSLHTQGSGKIRLPDGKILTVSYAQSNGRPFRSVTLNMLDQKKISRSETTYRGFKNWLKSKSNQEILEILSHNERYVFFRLVDKEPVGALGQPVTPGRTIATDPDYYPQGALAFIRLRKPVLTDDYLVKSRVDFSRFVLNQDKGSAIKGPKRVDLFCGFGPEAQAVAGSLKEKGDLFFLLLK